MIKKSDLKLDFVNFQEYWDESSSYPMGILYISACLKKHGFTNIGYIDHVCMLRKMGAKTGRLFEFMAPEWQLEQMNRERKNNLDSMFKYLKEQQPRIILLGSVTTFHLIELVDLIPRLREQFREQLILAGGPHFGKDPVLDQELLERYDGLDGIVVGEAEETIVDVATQFYSEFCKNNSIPSRAKFQDKLAEISGVLIRGKTLTPREPPKLENLPSPDMELLEKHLKDPWNYAYVPKYRLSNRRNPITWISRAVVEAFDGGGGGGIEDDVRYFDQFASNDYRFPFGVIVGSRGCPYVCSFCCSHAQRRLHSTCYIFNQIMDLNKRYGIRLFVFFDPLFTSSSIAEQKRVDELCRMICDAGIEIKYMIDIRADVIVNLPESLLDLMMRSGCVEFNLGLEKGSDRLLQKMMKGITIADHRNAVAKLRRIAKSSGKKVIVNGTFILGGPDETKADIRETLIHCFSLHLDQATLYPLEICPGTKISEEAFMKEILKPGLASFLDATQYPLYATEGLPRSYLVHIKKKTEQALDAMEEFKKDMQGFERQFLPEDKRDEFSDFEILQTKKLHDLIEQYIDEALDYLRKHPSEGLDNRRLVPQIEKAVQKVNTEISSLEQKLIQKYPNYDYHYGDYYPGTLLRNWKHFLKLFEKLFSKDNFLLFCGSNKH
jgi:radical SAM superfamily enzyme YgiQ (UPF0313 family)